jgi:cytochrome c peroxidase
MLQFSKRRCRYRGLLLLLLVLFSVFGIMLSRSIIPEQFGVNGSSVMADPLLNAQAAALQSSPAREPIVPIPLMIALDSRKIALGKQLFQDPQLSRTGKMSCASCHDLQRAGIDHLPQSIDNAGKALPRNAPTVFNSGFNAKQFWDGRVETLEAQIEATVQNPRVTAISWAEIITKLRRNSEYLYAFSAIYGKDGIQPSTIKDAIATFERSLITPNARFDQFLRGDVNAITAEEKLGYDRFKSYGCIACHQGINVGGNLFQTLGVMKPYYSQPEQAQLDPGRFKITKNYADFHAFRVPSLRNVELTSPYLHDGHVKTLEEAVKIMGDYQLGRTIPDEDVILIVKFLRTLTGQFLQEPS